MAIASCKWLGDRYQRRRGFGRASESTSRRVLGGEPLEERTVLSASTTYVDDGWAFVTDMGDTGLSVGDIVNNGNHGDGSMVGQYGINAFGTVSSGAFMGTLSGSGTINDAISNTMAGGTTQVLHYAASGSVTLDEPVTLRGEFTISSGDLTMDDPDAVLAPGADGIVGTITLSSGDLILNAGTLAIKIDEDGHPDNFVVNGGVTIDDDTQLLVVSGDYGAAAETEYVIVNSNEAVTPQFADLAEDATFVVGDREFQITYEGGSDNFDVVLTLGDYLPFITYVDLSWEAVSGPLVAGAEVTNGSVTTTYLEPSAANFNGFATAGYDTITDAVDAVVPAGSVTVFDGTYTENVTIDKRLVFRGAFTLNGALTAGSDVTLLPGGGTLTVDELTLSEGTSLMLSVSTVSSVDLIEVTDQLDLGGATLDLHFLSLGEDLEADILLIDNQGTDDVIGTFAGLAEGARLTLDGRAYWITYEGGDGNDVELIVPSAEVVARKIFYNNSHWDGNTSGISTSDDGAIAPDKTAYLPGDGLATIANVTSYSRGINGIVVDIAGSHPNITADDFLFRLGANNTPLSWSAAPSPAAVSVRSGAGVSGSDRVEITWADNAIEEQWLEVNVLSTADTGLAKPDTFYFGNKIGHMEHSAPAGAATVVSNASTVIANLGPAGILSPYDFDRSGVVTAGDRSILLAHLNPPLLPWIERRTTPTIDKVYGPRSWEAGTEVTLTTPLPVLDDGSPDTSVTGLSFYLDVNNNGILDSEDEEIADAEAVIDTGEPGEEDDRPMGWTATFDPGDFSDFGAGVIIVPRDGDGPIGAAPTPVFTPPVSPPATPTVSGRFWFSAVTPTVSVAANANGIVENMGVTVANAAISGSTDTAFVSASQQFVYSDVENGYPPSTGASSAGAYQGISDGGVAQILANADASAEAISPWYAVSSSANATYGQGTPTTTTFQINSNLPVGTPVVIIERQVVIGYASGAGEGQSNSAHDTVGVVGPGVIATLTQDFNIDEGEGYAAIRSTRILPAVVGQQIAVSYSGAAGASVVLTDEAAGVAEAGTIFQYTLSGR